ncbi:MAG: hypothetical protein ACM32O_04150 [Clostridia bacterium]
MKLRRWQGALAAVVVGASLWSGAPVHAESIGDEQSITAGAMSVAKRGMDMSENYAVWVTDHDDKQAITLYNLDNETVEKIADTDSIKSRPVTAGNYVAWVDYKQSSGDIYLYDIASKKEPVRLTDKTFKIKDNEIDISRDYVVWTDARDNNIYLYDIKMGGAAVKVTNSGKASRPTVSNMYLAWQDTRNGDADIYYYDLKMKKEYRATDDSDDQKNPDIFDDMIVFEDSRNNVIEIYEYDITNDSETRLTKSKSQDKGKESPEISGKYAVYYEDDELRIHNLSKNEWDEIDSDVVSSRMEAKLNSRYVLYAKEDDDDDVTLYLYDIKKDKTDTLGSQTGEPSSPDASNRYVVYISEGRDDLVVLYDVKTGLNTIISDKDDEPERPLVSDQYAVWYDNNKDILVSYDLKTGKRVEVTSDNDDPSNEIYDLNGQKLVWVDEGRRGYDVMVTDLKTMKSTDVENVSTDLKEVGISGNRIIWAVGDEGDIDIEVYDLEDERTNTIRQKIAELDGVTIGTDYAVWSEAQGSDYELFYYDFGNERTYQLFNKRQRNDQRKPKMSGNVLVYADNQASRDDETFYYDMYDLEGEEGLGLYPGEEGNPEQMAIGGNRVVWIDNRNEDPEVYMMAFTESTEDPGEPGEGTYLDLNFEKALLDGTFGKLVDEYEGKYDKIFFIFNQGTKDEEKISLEDALKVFDEFAKVLEDKGFGNVIVRVYE